MTVPLNHYKDILVIAEHEGGKLSAITMELLGKARELAAELGGEVVTIILGKGISSLAQDLIYYGADLVLVSDNPELDYYQTESYTTVIVEEVRKRKPEILLFGATDIGRDLAPRVACRLGAGLVADCTELSVDKQTKRLLQTKPGFGGKMMFTFICPRSVPQMATVPPGIFKPAERDETRKGKIEHLKVSLSTKAFPLKVIQRVKSERESLRIEEAEVIVAGGRGMGGEKGLYNIRELAKLLGAEIGATKDVCDAGWLSEEHMIGQTGKMVKPSLYFGCGISGAIQHTVGLRDVKVIVAINKDANAEIFKIADYGLIADLNEALPMLIEELKREGGNS